MKRGEIYFIKSTYREEGSEQRADRPAVIVSNNANNENSEVVEIVYTTTRPKNDLPTHVSTRSTLLPSTILCEQVQSVSKLRIGNLIGALTEQELTAVDAALAISLGLDFKKTTETRKPTEEEPEKLLHEKTAQQPSQNATPAPDAQLIKLETERDLYRQLYRELLENITEGAKA